MGGRGWVFDDGDGVVCDKGMAVRLLEVEERERERDEKREWGGER